MNKEIKTISPFKNFCMTIGALPTSYLESMSYYETLCWLCKYLENTINPAINQNAEALKELQEYIANYFDNLDVQEEVNNKLDEMAESGELAELIEDIFPILPEATCEIVGHRGCPEDTIENTITSFRYAYNKGLKYIETDVQMTADGYMVLFHNSTVDSTTDGTGTVNQLNYSYLRSLVYTSGGNISNYPNTHINDIDELINFLKNSDIKCFLEIKAGWTMAQIESLYNKIKTGNLLNKIIFISFDYTYLEKLRELDNRILIGYLVDDLSSTVINYCKDNKFIACPSHYNLTKLLVDSAHDNGVSVYVWTISSHTTYQSVIAMNVDYICTNSRLYCYPGFYTPLGYYKYVFPYFSNFDKELLEKGNNIVPCSTGTSYPTGIFINKARAISTDKIYVNTGDTVSFTIDSTKYSIALPNYASNDDEAVDTGWLTGSSYTIVNADTKYCFCYFKKVDGSDFKDYELDEVGQVANNIRITRA